MRPLAILGGTFDPIHNAHLRVAWEAAELLAAEVRLVPARVPPHRPQPVASATQRAALLRAALQGQGMLVADERELHREGPSYTVDTLAGLRAEIGPQRPLVLLVGADAFAGLDRWHRWRELFRYAHVGVLSRPGPVPLPEAELAAERAQRLAGIEALRATPCGHVCDLPVTPLRISASAIRELLAAGRSPRWLVPAALIDDPQLLAPYRPAGGARPGS